MKILVYATGVIGGGLALIFPAACYDLRVC